MLALKISGHHNRTMVVAPTRLPICFIDNPYEVKKFKGEILCNDIKLITSFMKIRQLIGNLL